MLSVTNKAALLDLSRHEYGNKSGGCKKRKKAKVFARVMGRRMKCGR